MSANTPELQNTSTDDQGKRRRSPISPSENIVSKKHHPSTMQGEKQLGTLTMDQLLLAVRSAIKAENVATKDDLAEIKQEIDYLRSQNEVLKKTVEDLLSREETLKDRLERLEDNERKNNLIIRGLNDNNDPKTNIQKLCSETLGIKEAIEVKSAMKIGETKPGKPIILVELNSADNVKTVLKNCNKLTGTQTSVSRDPSRTIRLTLVLTEAFLVRGSAYLCVYKSAYFYTRCH